MTPGNFYIDGNVYDLSAVKGSEKVNHDQISKWEKSYETMTVEKPFWIKAPVDAESSAQAYKSVLKHAGASFRRDDIDKRIVKEVKSGKAMFRGSVTGVPGIIDSENDVL